MSKARTDMGVSVRDAADATRLRVDVIENMEAGKFDYNLPEIYKRGFLRIYAAYLKLDEAQVMEMYLSASQRVPSEEGRRKNIFQKASNEAERADSGFETPPASLESRFDSDASEEPARADSSDKFVKIAAALVGVILLAAVIIFAVSSMSKKAPEENAEIAINANMPTQPAPVSETAQAAVNEVPADAELTLSLTALADTYVLVYPDLKTPDGKPAEVFYTGPMQAGESRQFKSKVPVMLKLTDAERVKIERNGKEVDLKGAKGLRLFRIVAK
ncbi:MAG: helix-turn-helix domain-containing protein [Opitutales bacterium]|nr:helix-turn-helix domain-containing protein [Opitutales bacterium]